MAEGRGIDDRPALISSSCFCGYDVDLNGNGEPRLTSYRRVVLTVSREEIADAAGDGPVEHEIRLIRGEAIEFAPAGTGGEYQ